VTFVDASAIYAILDRADPNHSRARHAMAQLRAEDARLVTHAYVVVEVVALVQRRLGLGTVRRLVDDLLPIMEVIPVDAALHAEALEALLAAGQREVSLVDRTSFLVMRRHGIDRAFAFDADFATAGFEVIPAA
jgi:predicted nucleic acid-binding protein